MKEDTLTSENKKMSKEELQKLPDSTLLQMVEKSAGHTGADFSAYLSCDFSYSYLTGELKRRGYLNGWHKAGGSAKASVEDAHEPEIITLGKKSENESGRRITLTASKDVADVWRNLTLPLPDKQSITDAALKRFIDDVKAGRVKFEFRFD